VHHGHITLLGLVLKKSAKAGQETGKAISSFKFFLRKIDGSEDDKKDTM
jgi:hypothetical protein